MIGGLAALNLLNMISFLQTAEVSRPGSVFAVNAGETVTLHCPLFEKQETFFYWYKQPLGQMVQTVAFGSYNNVQLDKKFKDSRFHIREADVQYRLTITNVSKVDEATYFCHSGTAYSQSFANDIFLAVNDLNRQKPIRVRQSPNDASVQLGDPMNLQCSLFAEDQDSTVQCPGEHNVHWVRAGGDSHPGIIYIHKNKTEGRKNRTCVYRLSKTTQDSDSGTYYCAVATCGQILFGEGTKVTIGPKLDFLVLVLGGLLVGCVIVIATLIFYIIHRRRCEQHKELRTSVSLGHNKLTADQPNYPQDGDADTVNYVALDFSRRKHTPGMKKRDSQQESVYSYVRTDHHRPL